MKIFTLMLADSTGGQDIAPTEIDTIWVILMILGVALCVFFLWVLLQRAAGKELKQYFAKRLVESRRLTNLRLAVTLILPGVAAFVYSFVDPRIVLAGKGDWHSVVLLLLVVAAVVLYICSAYFLFRCEDLLEQIAENTEEELAKSEQERDHWRNELLLHRKVAGSLINVMAMRWSRINEYLMGRSSLPLSSPITHQDLQRVLDPQNHLATCLASLHSILANHYNGGIDDGKTLRVTFFEPEASGEFLVPVASTNGMRTNCVESPINGQFKEHFRISSQNSSGSLAAYASTQYNRSDPIMVPCADKANASDSPYKHLKPAHEERIKSISAYPCRGPGVENERRPVVLCDTDQVGFFSDSENDVQAFRRIMEDFCARVLYERSIQDLLDVEEGDQLSAAEEGQA